jgi:hypothetical protein
MTGPRAWLLSAASVVAFGLIAFGTAKLALGQEPGCAPPDVMRAELKRTFGEEPVAVGLTTRGTLIEVMTTLDGATFTIIETTAAGVSCVKAAGKGWLVKTPAVAGEPM